MPNNISCSECLAIIVSTIIMKVLGKYTASISIEEKDKRNFHMYRPYKFHETIRFTLILSQCFGVMPLYNISKNAQDVRFKWMSLRFLYAVAHVGGVLATGVICIFRLATQGFVIDETATTCFYIFNGFASIHFVYLAMRWQKILNEYYYVEYSMKNYTYHRNVKRINIFTATFFMFFGLIEHILFVLTNLDHSIKCDNYKQYPVEIYFGCAFPQWFTVVKYTHWAAVLVQITNSISTFTWNFTDLFIIIISISLREKFNQISIHIKQNKNPSATFWKDVREDYYRVSNLTKVVDSQIAGLVLISFINNIYFLCIQLYNSIKDREAIIDSVYFFYSFGYIVFRVVAVSLYSATLNEAARKPLKYLYSVPTDHYTTDVSRFITQINFLPNGITGHGFFLITKNFLLQAAATVVTFELMIFQFSPVIKKNYSSQYSSTSEIICIK